VNKLSYLKYCLDNKLFGNRNWIISAFSITRDKPNAKPYLGKLYSEPWGYSVLLDDVNQPEKREKIEDAKVGEPLFAFMDRIMVTPELASNVVQPIETTLGNLLFNHIAILSTFGPKHPFALGEISVPKLEESIAKKLEDTPLDGAERSNDKYYVDEYLKFIDALQFISSFAQLCTVAVTRISIKGPDGIKEYKAKLLKEYAGQLNDPIKLAEYEKKLVEFDMAYLSQDPGAMKFNSKKVSMSRRKLFLSVGAEIGFDETTTVNPILNSLSEGWSRDPSQYTGSMNSIRFGSYARGAETVKGGVAAKYLLRAANNFKILDKDCGSKLGIRRVYYNESDLAALVGRYVVESNGSSKLVEKKEEAGNYLGKRLIVRSPMYCSLQGDLLCKVCAGVSLSKYPTGLTIPLTEVSAIIMATSMAKMHTSGVTTAKMNIQTAFT
jgi:hypothetical protein